MSGRPVHSFEVVRTEQLSPHIVRVVLGGNGFGTFVPNQFTDAYCKVLFLRDDVEVAALPTPLTLDSFQVLPPERRPVIRTLTVRRTDPGEREIVIDCVVHGDHGVAGPWAATAQPGQPAYLMGPSGAYAPDPSADWHLLAGDESALPAIAAALEGLPPDAVAQAFVEVAGPDDEIELRSPAEVDVTWVYRGGRADLVAENRAGDHAPLIDAVRQASVAARAGAGVHPRGSPGGHAQSAAVCPQGARRGRQVGVDLGLLAPRAHRGDIPAVEGRVGGGGGRSGRRRVTRIMGGF